MKTSIFRRLWPLIIVFPFVALPGCVGTPGKIRKVDSPTAAELRASWKSYQTFCLNRGYGVSTAGSAILFQVKGDKAIQKSGDWQEVASDKAAQDCAGFLIRPSPVMSLLGENDAKFGYLIYEYKDSVSAVIIDSATISLFYYPSPKPGAP